MGELVDHLLAECFACAEVLPCEGVAYLSFRFTMEGVEKVCKDKTHGKTSAII